MSGLLLRDTGAESAERFAPDGRFGAGRVLRPGGKMAGERVCCQAIRAGMRSTSYPPLSLSSLSSVPLRLISLIDSPRFGTDRVCSQRRHRSRDKGYFLPNHLLFSLSSVPLRLISLIDSPRFGTDRLEKVYVAKEGITAGMRSTSYPIIFSSLFHPSLSVSFLLYTHHVLGRIGWTPHFWTDPPSRLEKGGCCQT